MVIRGRTRGNGKQLAEYLLAMNENEDIQILDVAGRGSVGDGFLHQTLLSMSLTSELTKSDKGLYHAQINPAYGEDKAMTPETWQLAASLLENELGLVDQRRIIVLHTKKGRTHAHVVWERYDHQKGIMRSDSFSRLAQDRARKEMEQVFRHQPTPHRNAKRPEMKTLLTTLWKKAATGKEFLQEAGKAGYSIAAGLQRRPFMVVDSTGRSFDLIRQLDGVKTKDVRDRLKGEKLPPEKTTIAYRRDSYKQVKEVAAVSEETEFDRRKQETAQQFAATRNDMMVRPDEQDMKNKQTAERFKDNKDSATFLDADKERRRKDILDKLKQARDRQKDKGIERD